MHFDRRLRRPPQAPMVLKGGVARISPTGRSRADRSYKASIGVYVTPPSTSRLQKRPSSKPPFSSVNYLNEVTSDQRQSMEAESVTASVWSQVGPRGSTLPPFDSSQPVPHLALVRTRPQPAVTEGAPTQSSIIKFPSVL